MSHMSEGLHGVVLAVAVVVTAAARGAQAQGFVTMQKLSAPLAHELVGERLRTARRRGRR